MMGDPVRCLPKVVHPDVAALKLQHNPRKVCLRLDATGECDYEEPGYSISAPARKQILS